MAPTPIAVSNPKFENAPRAAEGDPKKLGATPTIKDGVKGVNFAVYSSPDVTDMWVCLFDEKGNEKQYKLNPKQAYGKFLDGATLCNGKEWHGFIPDVGEGQRYGFRADGPFNLLKGNPNDLSTASAYHRNRLLTDPYGRASEDKDFDFKQGTSFFNYDPQDFSHKNIEDRYNNTKHRHCANIQDTAPYVPKSIVVDFERIKKERGCEEGKPLHRFSDATVCEAHVREATINFDGIPDAYKGTFKGMSHPKFIEQLKAMGKTVVEVMPIQRGKTHWKYDTYSFFDVEPSYAAKFNEDGTPNTQTPLEQFAEMVQALRKEGIEVWMDVVYNHTAEGDHTGPTCSFKGLDWRYYRHHYDDKDQDGKIIRNADGSERKGIFHPEHYLNITGTGNVMNTDHPQVRKLIVDNLAFFHSLGVSGFRFDLMKALGRAGGSADYRSDHPLFKELLNLTGRSISIDKNGHHDAHLDYVFLSGEPWDLDGSPVQLPTGIAEWRGEPSKILQESWRTLHGRPAKILATVLAGVGYMKCALTHDDFTAIDAVSFKDKTNPFDGSTHASVNSGAEGETKDPKIIDERIRRVKFGLALDALAQGAVLRKLGGWHSQGGNNNPYDNEAITHIPWGEKLNPTQKEILEFEKVCGQFKQKHPCLRRGEGNPFGQQVLGGQLPNPDFQVLHKEGDHEIAWLNANGRPMEGDWPNDHAFGFVLSGQTDRSENGKEIRDIPILALINGSSGTAEMTIPYSEVGTKWKVAFNSGGHNSKIKPGDILGEGKITLPPFTTVVFESASPQHKKQVELDWLARSQRDLDPSIRKL